MSANPLNRNGSDRLLGGLSFVSRTFEGRFEDSPYVLDMDANLYIGHADQFARDHHSAVDVVYHFLRQTGRLDGSIRDLRRDRRALLDAFAAFDLARTESDSEEFRILVFGTYDAEVLDSADDDLPAGPCGRSVNEVKREFYRLAQRLDVEFDNRELNEAQRRAEALFADPAPGSE